MMIQRIGALRSRYKAADSTPTRGGLGDAPELQGQVREAAGQWVELYVEWEPEQHREAANYCLEQVSSNGVERRDRWRDESDSCKGPGLLI